MKNKSLNYSWLFFIIIAGCSFSSSSVSFPKTPVQSPNEQVELIEVATQTITLTSTPLPTVTPSNTSTMTPTPSRLFIIINHATSCYAQTTNLYRGIESLVPGERIEVVGRYSTNDWWMVAIPIHIAPGPSPTPHILLPYNSSRETSTPTPFYHGDYCWINNDYVTVEGDPSIIPIMRCSELTFDVMCPRNTVCNKPSGYLCWPAED